MTGPPKQGNKGPREKGVKGTKILRPQEERFKTPEPTENKNKGKKRGLGT